MEYSRHAPVPQSVRCGGEGGEVSRLELGLMLVWWKGLASVKQFTSVFAVHSPMLPTNALVAGPTRTRFRLPKAPRFWGEKINLQENLRRKLESFIWKSAQQFFHSHISGRTQVCNVRFVTGPHQNLVLDSDQLACHCALKLVDSALTHAEKLTQPPASA